MAKAIITIEDTDLDAGRYSVSFTVEDTKLDDGFASAAHIAALFINEQFKNPAFVGAIWQFAEQLIEGREGARIANTQNAPSNDEGEPADEAA